MKRALLALTILFAGLGTQAAVTAEDVFGAFFGIIVNQINNANGGNTNNGNWGPEDDNLILKDNGKNILFGTSTLDLNDTVGVLNLPRCGASGNQRVSKVRFMVNGSDIYIYRLEVTYQNGLKENFSVNNDFTDGDRSKTFNLKGLNDRCIKRLRISGEVYEDNNGWNGNSGGPWSGNNGGWNNSNWPAPAGSVTIGWGKPSKPKKWKERSIISYVGIK